LLRSRLSKESPEVVPLTDGGAPGGFHGQDELERGRDQRLSYMGIITDMKLQV
jgi:hypothetical protein